MDLAKRSLIGRLPATPKGIRAEQQCAAAT